MSQEVLTTLQQWLSALVLYPGLLFALLFALAGEWLASAARPLLIRQRTRLPLPRYGFFQPLYDALKLAGRQPSEQARVGVANGAGANLLGLTAFLGPLLALMLMPLPGKPFAGDATRYDILTVLALLAVHPLVAAALRMREGGVRALEGAQGLGGLLTGLLPLLLAVAALVEVLGNRTLRLADLGVAPETAAQSLVRLLSGAVLLVALPWWNSRDSGVRGESTGLYLGHLVQSVALAVLWALLILPVPGDFIWATLVLLGGALLAYVAMRLVPERLWLGRSRRGAAGMVWSAAVPVSVIALAVGLWWGA